MSIVGRGVPRRACRRAARRGSFDGAASERGGELHRRARLSLVHVAASTEPPPNEAENVAANGQVGTCQPSFNGAASQQRRERRRCTGESSLGRLRESAPHPTRSRLQPRRRDELRRRLRRVDTEPEEKVPEHIATFGVRDDHVHEQMQRGFVSQLRVIGETLAVGVSLRDQEHRRTVGGTDRPPRPRIVIEVQAAAADLSLSGFGRRDLESVQVRVQR
jgi:hypothetical protein